MTGLTRRALLGAISALVACRPVSAKDARAICVVGAGIAGLAAGRHLANAGHRVTIIEARQRIGGRVHTINDFQTPVELGANWIHGDRGNPLVGLAQDSRTNLHPHDFDDFRIVAPDGRQLAGQEDRDMLTLSSRLYKVFEDAAETAEPGDTLHEWLERDRQFSRIATLKPDIAKAILRREVSGDYAADPSELAAGAWRFSDEFPGEDRLVTNGFRRMIDHLAEGMTIEVNTIVTAIDHDNSGAVIRTDKGDIRADIVIVTVPLGVLKSGNITFNPPLSKMRSNAIKRIGFGAFEKAVMVVDQVFDFGALNVAVATHAPWCNLVDMSPWTERPTILAYCGGDDARRAIAASDEQNRLWLLEAIRAAANDASLSSTGFRMSRWLSDPFSRGSYSFPTSAMKIEDHANLAGQETAALWFAGEACSKHPSTVHGALLSGLNVARAVG